MADRPSALSVPIALPAPLAKRAESASAGSTLVARLLSGNGVLRIAVTLSGQLFAFFAATEMVTAPRARALAVAAVGGAFNLAALVTFPLAGAVADRRGHARMLRWSPLIGAIACSISTLVALTHLRGAVGLAVLLVARAGEGVGAVCAVPSMFALLARVTENDPPARTRLMGFFEITALLGLSAGMFAAGILWGRFHATALVALVPLYVGAMPLLFIQNGDVPRVSVPRAEASHGIASAMRTLLRDPVCRAFVVSWIALNAVVGVLLQYLPYLLLLGARTPSQRLVGSFGGSGASLVLASVGALFVGGTAVWSFVGAKVPRRVMLAVSTSGVIGMAATLAMINHGGASAWFAPCALSIAVQGGMTPASLGLIGDLTASKDGSRGTAMGFFSLLMGLGQMLGGLIGGPFVARWQLDGLLVVDAILGAVALAAMPWIRPGAVRHAPATTSSIH